MLNFKSDNTSGVHKRLFEAMGTEVENYRIPYGEDEISYKARDLVRKAIGRDDAEVFFVTTGTAANVIALASILRPFESVVTCDTAHLHLEETGGFERFTGSKILTVPNYHGKLKVSDLEKEITKYTTYHETVPKVVSVSNLSEFGTVYTPEELKGISDFAHANGMYLHLDGTRIANAIVAAGVTPKEMFSDSGVDIGSFGGTKNGMMFGEVIISLNSEFNYALKYLIKQGFQLLSKIRFIAAQFIPYLEENLYYENAKNANELMGKLYNEIKDIEGLEFLHPVEANMMFLKRDEALREKFEGKLLVDESPEYLRLVTSFSTTEEDIEKVIEIFKS